MFNEMKDSYVLQYRVDVTFLSYHYTINICMFCDIHVSEGLFNKFVMQDFPFLSI
jgi:hypothetical protein